PVKPDHQWNLRAMGDADFWPTNRDHAGGSALAARVERSSMELGVLNWRATTDYVARLGGYHVLPPHQWWFHRDTEPGRRRGGLPAVQADGPDRSAAAVVR